MRVLLGWELGAGQGHIQRLAAFAQVLQAYGHEPVFALKSYNVKGFNFAWQSILAPCLPFSGREQSYSFADILATFSFDNVDLLKKHLQSWQEILVTLQPALVIADHAPGLVLAARQQVPTVVIGSHFAVPPPVDVFPSLRFPVPPEADVRQAKVRETIAQLTNLSIPLGQALNGDRSFIFSLPELDCYRFWRQNPHYVGVHNAPFPTRQPDADLNSTWAYLSSGYPLRDLVLNTLQPESDFKPLQEALLNKSLAIHHGGLTTAIACLLAGIPQLLLPQYLEQELNAIALTRLGVAQIVMQPTWESLLIAQAQATRLVPTATHVAQSLSTWNQNWLDPAISACLEFL